MSKNSSSLSTSNFQAKAKVDWTSFVYNFKSKTEEEFNSELELIRSLVIEKLELDVDVASGRNLLRDSKKAIAILWTKAFIKIELEGSFFSDVQDNLAKIRQTYRKLNSIVKNKGEVFHLSRMDLTQTIKGLSILQLVPDPKTYFYNFKHNKVIFEKEGLIESYYIKTNKITFCWYRKDIQSKLLSNELKEKQTSSYNDDIYTRVEVRLLAGERTLKLAASALYDKKIKSEVELVKRLLKEATKKRLVLRPVEKIQKRSWPIEERWRQLFRDLEAEKIEVKEELIKKFSEAKPKDLSKREAARFKAFLKRNGLNLEQAMELLGD